MLHYQWRREMKSGAEKRKANRRNCTVPILCKKGTAFDHSQTVDISRGGVGFISSKFIPVDTKMAVEIAMRPESDPVLTIGQVKWIQPLSHLACYRIGMVFQKLIQAPILV